MKFHGVIGILLLQILMSNARPTLRSELKHVFELINIQNIREISHEYFENDPSVQHLLSYLNSEEMALGWNVFVTSSEIEDIIEWMNNHGVHLEHEFQRISDQFIEIKPNHLRSEPFKSYSITVFEDELKEQIQVEELNTRIDDLLIDGNDFAHLYLILKVSRPALERLFETQEIQKVTEHLIELGVDVEFLKSFAYELLRWN